MWVWRKFYSTVVTKQDWRGKNPEHWQYCIKKSFTVKTIFTSEPKSQSMKTTEYSYNIAPFTTNFNLKGIILFIRCKAMWSSNRPVQNNAFINSSCTISQNYSTILLVSVGKVYCGKFRTYSSSITVMDHEAGIRCCTVWKKSIHSRSKSNNLPIYPWWEAIIPLCWNIPFYHKSMRFQPQTHLSFHQSSTLSKFNY